MVKWEEAGSYDHALVNFLVLFLRTAVCVFCFLIGGSFLELHGLYVRVCTIKQKWQETQTFQVDFDLKD